MNLKEYFTNLYSRFFRDSFLNSLSYSVLIFYLISGIYSSFIIKADNPSRCGDFSVFFAAGITAIKNPDKLYDSEYIIDLQGKYWPEEKNIGFNSFAYPPFTALILIVFSFFPPLVSKLLYVCLSLIFLYFSARILKTKFLNSFSSINICSLILLFSPFAIGINSGQNNSLSFLLLILIALSIEKNKFINTGALIGLWNFKPQFGIPCLILSLFLKNTNKTKILLGYSIVTSLEIVVSLIYFGNDIFKNWFSSLTLNTTHNAIMLEKISLISSILSLTPWAKALELNLYIIYLTLLVTTLCVFLLSYMFYKSRDNPFIIGSLIALLSPQTGLYDSGLIIPFIIQKLHGNKSELAWQMIFGGLLITLVSTIQRDYNIQIYPLFVLYLTWWGFKRREKNRQDRRGW